MRGPAAVGDRQALIWHELECGAYAGDLPVWERLAGEAGGPLLDLGCGAGRVALHLARDGHSVLGVDVEPVFVAELNRRALRAELPASADVGDVRSLDLGDPRFGLTIAPMQLIQLFASEGERRECLRRIASHLREEGRAALAITGTADTAIGPPPPLPDAREIDGWVYSSLPIELRRTDGGMVVSRLRQTVSPQGKLDEERFDVTLVDLPPEQLEAEARACGLQPHERLTVPPTSDHAGSTVVVLEAG